MRPETCRRRRAWSWQPSEAVLVYHVAVRLGAAMPRALCCRILASQSGGRRIPEWWCMSRPTLLSLGAGQAWRSHMDCQQHRRTCEGRLARFA